ncbi:hypothetical protein CDAR_303871 [Caerostris darwini]|uniref:Uncharacterized protein n=1 Tax=Caerostris darwini TaxID=1538125 RepID=A0AAV4T589_9ARAC|nr:hypothetical protein CDAR_303871 [Caerostris darwini]
MCPIGIANYPKALRQKLDASDYETFLKKSGLTKIICEDERQLFFHEDVESCFMAIRHCNLASDVPSIRRDEFDQDFSQEFLRHIEPDPDDGRFYVKFTVVRIIAKKEN